MERLKAFRVSINHSQEKMAEKIGVSDSFYKKVEQGNRSPSYNFIRKFKTAFPEIDTNIFFK